MINSNSLKNLRPPSHSREKLIELGKKVGLSNKGKLLNEKHFKWKGDKVGYRALHAWVTRRLGKPIICTFEDFTCKGRFEWASLSHKAKRDLNDYISLCSSHHNKFDKRFFKQ